jgi:hypothetical protein
MPHAVRASHDEPAHEPSPAMTAAYFRAWLSAFAFTQIIEVPIYRRHLDVSWLAAFGASALTHPVVWFVFFNRGVHLSYTTKLVSAELFAWLFEAAYFRWLFGKKRALLWTLIANTASLTLGFISRALFDLP